MNIFQRKMGFLLSRPCTTSWARAECGNMAERDRAEMPCTTMENGQVFHWTTVRSFLASTFIFFQSIHTKLFNDGFIYSSNQCIFWACIICQIPCMVLERWWRIRKTCELVARVSFSGEEHRWIIRQCQHVVIGALEEGNVLWRHREDTETNANPCESRKAFWRKWHLS